MLPTRPSMAVVAMGAIALLAGCAGPAEQKRASPDDTACVPAAQADPLVGKWLSVRRESGVSGELKTFFDLRADGTMSYTEQLTRPKRPPQGLAETGCWRRDGDAFVLRTLESNGSPVDTKDPIYQNRYQLTGKAGERLSLRSPDGVKLDARRMPPDYRLAW